MRVQVKQNFGTKILDWTTKKYCQSEAYRVSDQQIIFMAKTINITTHMYSRNAFRCGRAACEQKKEWNNVRS